MNKKLFMYMKKVISGEFVLPCMIELHPTTECNHDCIWCIMREHRKDYGELSHSQLFSIAKQLYEDFEMKYIFLSGSGEPLLNNNLFLPFHYKNKTYSNYFELLYSFGISIGMSTNGELLKKLIETKSYKYIDAIRISVDSGCEEEYEKLHHSKNKYKLKNLVNDIEEYYHISRKKVILSYLVHELNKDSYVRLAQMFKEPKAVEKIEIKRLNGDMRSFHEKDFYINNILISFAKEKIYPKYNYAHAISILIDAKGDIYPCCHMIDDRKNCLGNIKDKTIKSLILENYDKLQSFNCARCSSLEINLTLNKFKEIGGDKCDIV